VLHSHLEMEGAPPPIPPPSGIPPHSAANPPQLDANGMTPAGVTAASLTPDKSMIPRLVSPPLQSAYSLLSFHQSINSVPLMKLASIDGHIWLSSDLLGCTKSSFTDSELL